MDPKWRLGEQNMLQAMTVTCAVRALTIQNIPALSAEFRYVINARYLKKIRIFQDGVLVKALALVNHVQTRIRQREHFRRYSQENQVVKTTNVQIKEKRE